MHVGIVSSTDPFPFQLCIQSFLQVAHYCTPPDGRIPLPLKGVIIHVGIVTSTDPHFNNVISRLYKHTNDIVHFLTQFKVGGEYRLAP